MKRRIGIAVAGAVLAAGMAGGAGFAATNGTNGTNSTRTSTSVSSHDPAVAAHAIHCANLLIERANVLQQVGSAKNPAHAKRLVRRANQLLQQWQRQCL
jgi:hypothetical protein